MEKTKKTKPENKDSMTELIRRTDTENPRPEDMERIRKLLDENDLLVRINESSEQAFKGVINSFTKSELMKDLFKRQIDAKRKALDYDSENVMVQMLINQVILCHIRLTTYEAHHAKLVNQSHTLDQGVYWDKMLSGYQRRFQKACEALAKVKKLLSEVELRTQQAKHKKSQNTLNSQRLYRMLSDSDG